MVRRIQERADMEDVRDGEKGEVGTGVYSIQHVRSSVRNNFAIHHSSVTTRWIRLYNIIDIHCSSASAS
jgi:hypothetical protein